MSGAKDVEGRKSERRPSQVPKQSQVQKKLAAIEGKLIQTDVKVPFIKTTKADTIFGIVILLNAAFMGVDIEMNTQGFNWYIWVVESLFLVVFGVEVVLRLQAEYPQLRKYFDAWGTFDLFVTVMGMIDTWILTFALEQAEGSNPMGSLGALRTLRLFRLVRLVRVLRMFNELVVLIQTIVDSMRAVAWMSLLLGMIMYTGAIMTVMLIGIPHRENDPDVALHFGSLGSALFSHFCVVTLEAWPDIAMAAIKINRMWAFYFVSVIVLTNFTLLNLMVGVIVERIIRVAAEQENELASFVAESEQFGVTLRALFDSADMDASGTVTRREIRTLLEDPRTHEIMSAFGINLNIPKQTLHLIMDVSREGDTTFEEFLHACMRLCGSKGNVHSVFVQGDICAVQREMETRLTAIEASLEKYMRQGDFEPPKRTSRVGTGPEATVAELLEALDRLTQTQQFMFAEVHALKEYVALQKRGTPAEPFLADAGPLLLHKVGKELTDCCLDSMFTQRRVGGLPTLPSTQRGISVGSAGGTSSASTGDLRALTRQGLEAEFRSKRGR